MNVDLCVLSIIIYITGIYNGLDASLTLIMMGAILGFLVYNFYPAKKSVSEISEDQFALSELLQFIFNSAIREGNEIWVYIPSIRMRMLLKRWIEKNSPIIPQSNRE